MNRADLEAPIDRVRRRHNRRVLIVLGAACLTLIAGLAAIDALVPPGPVVSSFQAVPPELAALADKARLASPVVAWCAGEFRAGRPGAYAVAVTSPAGSGRYLALDPDATVASLADFSGRPDLACYTPDEARKLNAAIGESETIDGGIAPRWSTTVVCGFLDSTSAACWQYSPDDRAFVRVGAWVT